MIILRIISIVIMNLYFFVFLIMIPVQMAPVSPDITDIPVEIPASFLNKKIFTLFKPKGMMYNSTFVEKQFRTDKQSIIEPTNNR